MRHRRENGYRLSQRFVAEAEQRIMRQRVRIAEIKEKGRPSEEAEALLRRFERALAEIRNHLALMQDLMTPRRGGRI